MNFAPRGSLCLKTGAATPPDVEGDVGPGRTGPTAVLAVPLELEVVPGAVFESGRNPGRVVLLVEGPVVLEDIPEVPNGGGGRNPHDVLPVFETLRGVFHGLTITFLQRTLHFSKTFLFLFRAIP